MPEGFYQGNRVGDAAAAAPVRDQVTERAGQRRWGGTTRNRYELLEGPRALVRVGGRTLLQFSGFGGDGGPMTYWSVAYGYS